MTDNPSGFVLPPEADEQRMSYRTVGLLVTEISKHGGLEYVTAEHRMADIELVAWDNATVGPSRRVNRVVFTAPVGTWKVGAEVTADVFSSVFDRLTERHRADKEAL